MGLDPGTPAVDHHGVSAETKLPARNKFSPKNPPAGGFAFSQPFLGVQPDSQLPPPPHRPASTFFPAKDLFGRPARPPPGGCFINPPIGFLRYFRGGGHPLPPRLGDGVPPAGGALGPVPRRALPRRRRLPLPPPALPAAVGLPRCPGGLLPGRGLPGRSRLGLRWCRGAPQFSSLWASDPPLS